MSKIWTYGQNACPDTRHKISEIVSMSGKRAFWGLARFLLIG